MRACREPKNMYLGATVGHDLALKKNNRQFIKASFNDLESFWVGSGEKVSIGMKAT
jgi:hypothetical protein